MAKRRGTKCRPGQGRFTVVRVNMDPHDSHAARSFEEALLLASPDRGAHVDVFRTCATDSGAARLPSTYLKKGALVRSFRYRGR